jgi:hypothetical protein
MHFDTLSKATAPVKLPISQLSLAPYGPSCPLAAEKELALASVRLGLVEPYGHEVNIFPTQV